MMNLEEAMARIAELEEQNRRLSIIKGEQRSMLPDEAAEIAPFLFTDYGRPYEYMNETTIISRAVRKMCFQPVTKNKRCRDRSYISDFPVTLKDMTDEQYDAYLGVMVEILRTIAECRKEHFDTTKES